MITTNEYLEETSKINKRIALVTVLLIVGLGFVLLLSFVGAQQKTIVNETVVAENTSAPIQQVEPIQNNITYVTPEYYYAIKYAKEREQYLQYQKQQAQEAEQKRQEYIKYNTPKLITEMNLYGNYYRDYQYQDKVVFTKNGQTYGWYRLVE